MIELLEQSFTYIFAAGVICSFFLLLLVKDSDTPRWLDVFAGVLLIVIAAIFLGMFNDLQGLVTENSDGSEKAKQLFANYQIAILIFPFVSAAIGTNLISHALTYGRDYSKSSPIDETLKKLPYVFLKTIAICSIIGLLIWAIVAYINKNKSISARA